MMLRSKRVVTTISGVAVKGNMARNRNTLKRSLSEGRSTRRRSVLQALSSCDYISGDQQSSSAEEQSSVSKAKNNLSTEMGKCNSAVIPSSTSSPQVLPKANQLPSPSEDPERSFEMEESIVEVIPIELPDISVLETKSHQPSSDDKSTDADTSDIIIISDSPGQGSVGSKALKSIAREMSQLQVRKRKVSDESGVEILCDISGSRPRKQQKTGSDIKEKKLWTNTTIKNNFTITVSDTDRKVSQPTKNEKTKDVINIASERSSGDGDDIIFISAEDEEVSVIDTQKGHNPLQEDVIILDSPPAPTPVQTSDKKPKKMVSASTSITGLIPHYTKHLLDYIALDGKPPATASGSSTCTPLLPSGSREMVHKHIPVLKGPWGPKGVRQRRKQRGPLRNRISNARNRDPAVQSDCVPVPTCPPPSHNVTVNPISIVTNPTQISTNQNSTTQNVTPEGCVQSAPEVPQSPACTYGTNIYNPNASEKEEDGLRPVIIDGNNIAMGHGKGKTFSWRGLHICIKYFSKRGHKVTAFVPRFRKGFCPPELRSEMEDYERSGQVVFTPSRRVEGRLIVPYDDRFIVQCAAELGGVIVSTDNYRDLLSENSTWKETIEKRLLMFTWVGDLLMFPHDPLGRHGPKLEEFLRFPKK